MQGLSTAIFAEWDFMWLYLLWWLVLCHGNVAWQVFLINYFHSRPWRERTIAIVHRIHHPSLILIPAYAFYATGWSGPKLLWGGDWRNLPLSWCFFWTICALSTICFFAGALRNRFRPQPQQHRLVSRHRHHIGQDSRAQEGISTPRTWLLNLPGNEQLQLQVVQREFRLSSLPSAWDGLTILHFSDVHLYGKVDVSYFERVFACAQSLQADMICFTGDLLDTMKCLPWLKSTFGQMQAPLGCFYILGNHDWLFCDPDAVRTELRSLNWRDVTTKPETLRRDNQTIVIAGSEAPWMGENPEFTGMDDQAFRILLSHTPDNIQHARNHNVSLMLSGHNHGGQIRLPFVGPVYCPSRFGCYYASGIFWEEPVMLHVSQGVSGRDPIRYGCPPEITKITLRRDRQGHSASE